MTVQAIKITAAKQAAVILLALLKTYVDFSHEIPHEGLISLGSLLICPSSTFLCRCTKNQQRNLTKPFINKWMLLI